MDVSKRDSGEKEYGSRMCSLKVFGGGGGCPVAVFQHLKDCGVEKASTRHKGQKEIRMVDASRCKDLIRHV